VAILSPSFAAPGKWSHVYELSNILQAYKKLVIAIIKSKAIKINQKDHEEKSK
jgi:hypothetical protein